MVPPTLPPITDPTENEMDEPARKHTICNRIYKKVFLKFYSLPSFLYISFQKLKSLLLAGKRFETLPRHRQTFFFFLI